MSGGSLDYVYGRVRDVAEDIAGRAKTPLQAAFAKHLFLVAEALHDLEWVWSCDYGPGDEEAAIRRVLAPGAPLDAAREQAEAALERLRAELRRASSTNSSTSAHSSGDGE